MNMRSIEGVPGYFISSCGKAFSQRQRDPNDPLRELKTWPDAYGYPYIVVYIDGVRRWRKIHRLVAAAFVPKPPGKEWVCHRNDIKTDNRAENLYWGSPLDNGRDRVKNGLTMKGRDDYKGSDNPRAQLTEQQVYEIRELYTGQYGNLAVLASIYGVSSTTIGYIGRRQTWTHLPERERTALVSLPTYKRPKRQGSGPSEGSNEQRAF